MTNEIDKSDKYAQKELNPILKKMIDDSQVEVLELNQKDDDDFNGNTSEEMLQLKHHHKKHLKQKHVKNGKKSHKKHHKKHHSKKDHSKWIGSNI